MMIRVYSWKSWIDVGFKLSSFLQQQQQFKVGSNVGES